MFSALTQMMRDFAKLAAGNELLLLQELDLRMAQGCISHLQFSIGQAGPLGCSFVVTDRKGSPCEIMNIDAPSTELRFSFAARDGQHRE